MRRFYFLLLAFMLFGCATPHFPDQNDVATVEHTFNPEIFSYGGKAVVIIQEQNNIPSSIKLHGQLTFADYDGKQYTFDIDDTSVFMLNPGIYTLKNFTLYGRSGYLSTHVDYADRYHGHFNIATGDVVYLGCLDTQTISSGEEKQHPDTNQKSQEIITVTKLKNQIDTLPPRFLSALQKQTSSPLTVRLLSWVDTSAKEVKK